MESLKYPITRHERICITINVTLLKSSSWFDKKKQWPECQNVQMSWKSSLCIYLATYIIHYQQRKVTNCQISVSRINMLDKIDSEKNDVAGV